MIARLWQLLTPEQITVWLLMAFLFIYFCYKEFPEIKARISAGPLKDQLSSGKAQALDQRLESIEKEVKQVNQKLERDYYRLNDLETKIRKTREAQSDINQELEIIMRALIAVLQGLQEQGANGPTKKAEQEIQTYLNKKAHAAESEEK
jgi:septal ring factor EnvC (AmiA/AmiB activator)